MKDINIHKKYKGNLCSIKSIENLYSDKLYVQEVIQNLLLRSELVIVEARRPIYLAELSIRGIEEIHDQLNNLKFSESGVSMTFSYEKKIENANFIIYLFKYVV